MQKTADNSNRAIINKARILAPTLSALFCCAIGSVFICAPVGAAPPTAPTMVRPRPEPPKKNLPPAPPAPTPPPPAPGTAPLLGGFPVFFGSIFNKDISALPVASYSGTVIGSVGTSRLHADFGTVWEGLQNGIPFNVSGNMAATVTFDYPDESDPGPYLFTPAPNIEATAKAGDAANISDGRDHHCLTVGTDGKLYELYQARKTSSNSWHAMSGAIWSLNSNKMRPAGWTSSDAAGLPITPLLVKYSEVQAGTIAHALRFTLGRTQNKYIWPASHQAGSANTSYCLMGARFRLKQGFDVSTYPREAQVILVALKKYGMILADNGSNGYIQGEPNPNWIDDNLARLGSVRLSDFEIVEESALQTTPNSYQSN